MTKNNGWLRLVLGMAVMVFGTMAVINRPDPQRWTGRSEDSIPSRLESTAPPLAQIAVQPTPSPQTSPTPKPSCILEFTTIYDSCGHKSVKVEQGEAGLTLEEVAAHHVPWQVTQTDKGFALVRTLHQYCPDHIRIRLEGNDIHLYHNADNGKELTEFSVLNNLSESLPEEALEELRSGIDFANMEELESYLESMNS